MKWTAWICAPVLTLSLTTLAKTTKPAPRRAGRRPTQAETAPTRFRVVYGEKTTSFVLSKVSTGGRVEFANTEGARATKTISAADYEYLKSKVAALKGPTNRSEYCPRSFVTVTTAERELLGCLGAPNALAKDLQETTNLLSLLF